MENLWYDKLGKPIKDYNEIEQKLRDQNYKTIKKETLKNGIVISTAWLGLDHSWGITKKPLIFETMVFQFKNNLDYLDCERYATETEALDGHQKMVRKWKKKLKKYKPENE